MSKWHCFVFSGKYFVSLWVIIDVLQLMIFFICHPCWEVRRMNYDTTRRIVSAAPQLTEPLLVEFMNFTSVVEEKLCISKLRCNSFLYTPLILFNSSHWGGCRQNKHLEPWPSLLSSVCSSYGSVALVDAVGSSFQSYLNILLITILNTSVCGGLSVLICTFKYPSLHIVSHILSDMVAGI